MKVVVVESPAKAKTINKYLGKGYEVLASFGHVRDLPPKDGSVDPEDDFQMIWEVESRGAKRVSRDRQGRQRRRQADPRHRPGPRGRGDFLARRRGAEREARAEGHAGRARHLQRHHQGRGADAPCASRARSTRRWSTPIWPAAPSIISSASRSRRCCGASSPARARPAACNRWRCASSATASSRSRTFVPQEYWSIVATLATKDGGVFDARLVGADGKKIQRLDIGKGEEAEAFKRDLELADVHGRQRRGEAGQAPSGAALHDLDLAAGGLAQARARAGADHAHRPAPLRGRRDRRRDGRPHHLHADRRRRHGAGGGARHPRRVIAKRIRRALSCPTRRAATRRRPRTRRRRTRRSVRPTWAALPSSGGALSRAGAGAALRADLDPHRREPDGIGRAGAHHGRHRGAGRPAPARPARHRPGREVRRLPDALPGGPGRRARGAEGRGRRGAACRR